MRAHGACFTRHNRLVKSSEYQRVFDQAYRSASAAFTILARRNIKGDARLGLVVSLRCARSAVARNRLKRLVREDFRHRQEQLKGLDIVVIGKQGAPQQTNAQLRGLLEQHWKNIEQWARS